MGILMNRIPQGELAIALAVFSTLSCSDRKPTDITGIQSDSTIDATRVVASVSVTLAQDSIDVGKTTQATASIADRRGKPIRRSVTWSSSNPSIASVSTSG